MKARPKTTRGDWRASVFRAELARRSLHFSTLFEEMRGDSELVARVEKEHGRFPGSSHLYQRCRAGGLRSEAIAEWIAQRLGVPLDELWPPIEPMDGESR